MDSACDRIKALVLCILHLCGGDNSEIRKSKKPLHDSSSSESAIGESIQEASERIASEFEFTRDDLRKAVKAFIQQLNDGLQKPGTTIEQLPSFITKVPTGSEKGVYLAVDLGGTNLRVCSITLKGDGTHSMIQFKIPIPSACMVSKTTKALFSFIAQSIRDFLMSNYPGSLSNSIDENGHPSHFNLGFTFSHAIDQIALDSGILLRWSKGFDIDGAVGQNMCKLLQAELDELNLPVHVSAIINDTVGTLMARAYASPSSTRTIMGAVFGTGTNGAYIEKRSRISKMSPLASLTTNGMNMEDIMIVNSEWGNFDQKLQFLPNTPYDKAVDLGSVNPGIELYEKRISGMYLGEIFRFAILALIENYPVSIFRNCLVPEDSQLHVKWGIDSEFMSSLESDTDLKLTRSIIEIETRMGIANASREDATALKTISHAIGRRSARLGAVALGAVVLQTDSLEICNVEGRLQVDIGVDGSLIEMYPGFVEEIRGALRDIEEIGVDGEKLINIAIAKDGSGVGAALTAHIAAVSDAK